MERDALPLKLEGSCLVAAGHSFLTDISTRIFTDEAAQGDAPGLVLGLEASAVSGSSFDNVQLGRLACNRFLACARIKLYWMTPEWGERGADIPPETQFLLLQISTEGPYAVLLPLIDSGTFRATLRPASYPTRATGARQHEVHLRVESGDDAVRAARWPAALYVQAGWDPYALVTTAVQAAAQLSGTAKPLSEKQLPAMLDVFGWCTWDAFYSRVSAQGVEEGLRALASGGVSPRFLITDDGWQCTDVDQEWQPIKTPNDIARIEAEVEVLLKAAKRSGAALSELANVAEVVTPADDPLLTLPALVATDPAHPIPAPPPRRRSWWMWLTGRLTGVLEVAVISVYKEVVERAKAGSWGIQVAKWLFRGPLRRSTMRWMAKTSDHVRRLLRVTANGKFAGPSMGPETPHSAPEDLAAVVRNVRKHGVDYVYCWHALYGYWAGISLETPEMAPFRPVMVYPEPTPGVLDVDPCFAWNYQVISGIGVARDAPGLYQAMHSYLEGSGVDGIKVDCQATLGMMGGGRPGLGGGPALSAQYQAALETSVANHFPGNNLINCMCHSTENLYRMTDTALVRSSDDFWPRDPASHTTHVAVNAFNSLFLAPILQPDWDMFHSQHPAAELHATARVISGGPIYVSDRPGKHNFALLRRVVLADGSILRCRQPGRPTPDCLFRDVMRDGISLLKVWNTNAIGGVVAVFNTQGAWWCRDTRMYIIGKGKAPTLATSVRPADNPTFQESAGGAAQSYVIWSDKLQQASVVPLRGAVEVKLAGGGSDILTVMPLQGGKASFAPIGLINMLNAGGALVSVHAGGGAAEQGQHFTVKVRGLGRLVAYCGGAPRAVSVGGVPAKFDFDAGTCLCGVDVMDELDGLVTSVEYML